MKTEGLQLRSLKQSVSVEIWIFCFDLLIHALHRPGWCCKTVKFSTPWILFGCNKKSEKTNSNPFKLKNTNKDAEGEFVVVRGNRSLPQARRTHTKTHLRLTYRINILRRLCFAKSVTKQLTAECGVRRSDTIIAADVTSVKMCEENISSELRGEMVALEARCWHVSVCPGRVPTLRPPRAPQYEGALCRWVLQCCRRLGAAAVMRYAAK